MRVFMDLLKRLGWPKAAKGPTNSVTRRQEGRTDIYTFYDKRGRAFTMAVDREDPFGDKWWVLPEKRRRGQALTAGSVDAVRMLDDAADALTLGDIQIGDAGDRHNGLGTLMLRTLFGIARQQGVRYIHGSVRPEDQHATPGLLDWYRREGFSVREGGNWPLIAIYLDDVPDDVQARREE